MNFNLISGRLTLTFPMNLRGTKTVVEYGIVERLQTVYTTRHSQVYHAFKNLRL